VVFTVVDSFFWGQLPKMGLRLWHLLNMGKNDTERMFTRVSVKQLKEGYDVPLLPEGYPGPCRTKRRSQMRQKTRTAHGLA
jgi:hypothetical protein